MKVSNVILRLRAAQDVLTLEDVAVRLGISRELFDTVYGVQLEDSASKSFTVHLQGEANVDPALAEVFSNPGIGLQGPRR